MTNDRNALSASETPSCPLRPDSLTLYYDGQCSLCLAEVHLLTARNERGLLNFVDINDKDFADANHPVSRAAAEARMHGRLGSGRLLSGVPVFAEAYRRADLGFLVWLLSRSWTRPILGFTYDWFARHRHAISRLIGPPLLRLVRRWNAARKADPAS